MFSILSKLGFYPTPIDDSIHTAQKILSEAGCSNNELDGVEKHLMEKFESGEIDYGDITNSLILAAFEYAKEICESRISGIEISWYINCDDTHIYINGQPYEEGCVYKLREDFYFSDYSNEGEDLVADLCCYNDELLGDMLDTCHMGNKSASESICELLGYDNNSLTGVELLEDIDSGKTTVYFSFRFSDGGDITPEVNVMAKGIHRAKFTELETKHEITPFIMNAINRAIDEDELSKEDIALLLQAKEKLI